MSDRPDYQEEFIIVGSDIDIPVSIDAITVTLDVDIVAQSVGNIGIDIIAQTVGNLAVNIAASAVTVDVDISAQTVGDITIDITAQSVGVYQQPEWAALQGIDVNLIGTALAIVQSNWYQLITRNTTAGKTFYITGWGMYAQGGGGGVRGYLYNNSTATFLAVCGGYQGFNANFTKPLKLTSGQNLRAWGAQEIAANITLVVYVVGYEV